MAVLSPTFNRGMRSLTASVELESAPEEVFSLLCSVEKWPVWLSFLRTARRVEFGKPIELGSEVILRPGVPSAEREEEEQLYEVDQFISNHCLSLVGAYSARRRVDFRVERKTARSKLHVRVTYPSYHGRLVSFFEWWRRGRKLFAQLDTAMTNFKGLVEYRRNDAVLADL